MATIGDKVNHLSDLTHQRNELNAKIAEVQLEVDAAMRELNPHPPRPARGRPKGNGKQLTLPEVQ